MVLLREEHQYSQRDKMKNVVVCVNIDKKSLAALKKVKEYLPKSNVNLTLVHIWNKKAYDYPGDLIVPFYPNQSQAIEIEQEMKKQLDKQAYAFPDVEPKNFETCVFSSSSPKSDTVDFLKENKASLVICLSAQKGSIENFFHSSFTNYLSAHAPCDVLNLRVW